jgi:hypothetical protein
MIAGGSEPAPEGKGKGLAARPKLCVTVTAGPDVLDSRVPGSRCSAHASRG